MAVAGVEHAGGEGAAIGVLLVEDDDGDALLVEDDLAERLPDAELVRSRTLRESLSLPLTGVDCIVLDLGLPDASGVEAVAELRARFPGTSLVVLTGLADEAAGVQAVSAGAHDYLVKGRLEPGQLARAIRYSIGRRHSENAERGLMLAEVQAREVERLERGLAPRPLVEDTSVLVATCNRPGRSRALLGGDFFDLVQTEGGTLRAVIGDVCGHGADEAAIGVSMRASWRALTLSGMPLEPMLETLTRVFEHERHMPRLFATLCTLEIDLRSRSGRMVVAGHPSPLLIERDVVRSATTAQGAGAIGVGSIRGWPAEPLSLTPDWTLLLYTDGIVEGRVGEGPERLGEDGLRRLVTECIAEDPGWREHPSLLLERLIERAEALNGGSLTDDVAMLLLGQRGAGLPR
jgi:serine phosphatase RsbU (regulator of sigma subunit)